MERYRPLKGAAADAKKIRNYLVTTLGVHESHVILLLDEQATRKAIMGKFKELMQNLNIRRDDPILIYFAGHGAWIPAPDHLRGYSIGAQIEMICPVDIGKPDENGIVIPGIPDYVIAALLDNLAEAKGNNIVRYSSKDCQGGLYLRIYRLSYLTLATRLGQTGWGPFSSSTHVNSISHQQFL